MNKSFKLVTIFVIALTFLSGCGLLFDPDDKETLSLDWEPSFSKTIGKEEADRATLVLAIDNTESMLSKVSELSGDLEGMFRDLITAGWDIDLYVTTCAYVNKSFSSLKNSSTKSLNGNASIQEKVDVLMNGALPTQLDSGGDERCNQALEEAWSQIDTNNKVNISMLISNEDGCARSDENEMLPFIGGGEASNCTPFSHGRIGRANAQVGSSLSAWESAVSNYMSTWRPWFERTTTPLLTQPSHFVDFFNNVKEEGESRIENFSHIYVPIVVDTNRCLAQSLKEQAEKEHADYVAEKGDDAGFITRATVAAPGLSYLETFDGLSQEGILFDKEEGDLSICNDLSHVVNKIEREIKLRGSGAIFKLDRRIDLEKTGELEVAPPIVKIERRISEVDSEDFFTQQNISLEPLGLAWVKSGSDMYELLLYLDSPMINYDDVDRSVSVNNSAVLTIAPADRVTRLRFLPLDFKNGEQGFEIKN